MKYRYSIANIGIPSVEEEQENQIENLSDKWVCDICLDYIDKKKHYSYLTCLDPKCKMVSHLVCLAQIFLRCERNKNIKKFEDILGNNSNITNSDICQKIDTYYLLPKYGNYVNSYQKELVQQQNHIDRMVQQGYNEYDVKKQKEVLDETVQMIPDCKNRLNEAYKVLKDLVSKQDPSWVGTDELNKAEETLKEIELDRVEEKVGLKNSDS
ncbi:2819_t:CDS:2 [Entrophospora sp. SA101]|nr:15205_t:CDS:2 [Entrophospora sp. SA101]CAJ0747757.1 2819_t:CDS:2 [Entrophospora sp. SA101]CAJ0825974.1 9444_t:CDS:2 [Entrophospora sp. SA101]CAJ0913028.1 6772_t:CDS:2 [Entrophospora sp. SA101]